MKKTLIVVLGLGFLMIGKLSAQSDTLDKTRQFDFWIGEWEVFRNGTEQLAGYSSITSVIGGSAIEENYKTPNGQYLGTSLNAYNKEKDQWEQYYLDNGGMTLHITGGWSNGQMILQNNQIMQGKKVYNRISWTPLEDGTVRQLWEQRNTEAEEWKVSFDGIYKKRK